MRPKLWFYSYNKHSASVWNLLEVLDARLIKREGSTYRSRPSDIVVNWGSYRLPSIIRSVLNNPNSVEIATSKLETFRVLGERNVPIPEFTRTKGTAAAWLAKEYRVLGRDIDRGSEGAGITVYRPGQELGDHRFYVRYMPKLREFRVHVFQGNVIDVQEKLKRQGTDNSLVRNTANGYVFARGNLGENPAPKCVLDVAISAVAGLGLDFGGVDVGLSKKGNPTVYEVNTAPGIEGSTVQSYAQVLSRL